MASHFGGSSPSALAARFARLVERLGGDMAAAKAQGQQRDLLAAVSAQEPATLNQIAKKVGRGAPAVSRSVDALVRAGLVERTQDPDNRRRLALRLTDKGRSALETGPASGSQLTVKLERLAHSELRAVERAIEILERGP